MIVILPFIRSGIVTLKIKMNFINCLLLGELNLTRQFDDYTYLNHSGCTNVQSINDEANFKIVEVIYAAVFH